VTSGFGFLAFNARSMRTRASRPSAAPIRQWIGVCQISPPGVDCALIRYYVAEHTKVKALAWAIKEGYSWRQISEARRCLK
jgi:hypothetical protein